MIKLPLKRIAWLVMVAQALSAQEIELPGEVSRFNTSVSAGYIQSKNFNGGGGSVRLGYEIEQGHHAELEAGYFFESANVNSTNQGFAVSSKLAAAAIPVTYNQKRKVDLNMIPLMLNYRYVGYFDMPDQTNTMSWYAGVGAGAVIFDWDNKYSWSSSSVVPGANMGGGATYSETKTVFGAQCFLGLGYAVTEKLTTTIGARLLGTQKYTYGGKSFGDPTNPVNNFTTPSVSTQTIHWMVEAGVDYTW